MLDRPPRGARADNSRPPSPAQQTARVSMWTVEHNRPTTQATISNKRKRRQKKAPYPLVHHELSPERDVE